MYQDQDRTTPYGGPAGGRVFLHQFKHGTSSGRLAIFALIAGLLGIAVSIASITLLLSYRSTTTNQIHQIRQELAQEQSAQSRDAGSVSGISTKVNNLAGTVSGIAGVLAPYNMICSQALVTQAGTGQFWYACADRNPG